MALNKEQQQSFMDVIKFINDPHQRSMNLSGGAGTGKTYFIAQVARGILRHKTAGVWIHGKHVSGSPLEAVAVTATTNKAVAVINEAIGKEINDVQTVYSFMNLRVSENFTTGEISIVPTKTWKVYSGILLIIDECSMINKDLFKWLEKGLDNTCKILYVGDKNQLAPIKEELSPIYTQDYPISTLTIPVRNAEQPALMALCEQAKQTVLTGIFTPIVEVPGVIDFIDGTQLKGILEREYSQEDVGRRVLAYTNKRVIEYNTHIRGLRGYSQPFEVGEVLSNNASTNGGEGDTLYTDQMIRVVEIIDDVENVGVITGYQVRTIAMTVEDVTTKVQYAVTCFADINDRAEVLKYHSSRKKWDQYFHVKNNFPDLRSVAASTIHKAQGSTYDSVVVDLTDIGRCTINSQTARMCYVALSRPKSRLYIRGQLPERYFK
jgi:hypothetical protein